MKGQLLIDRIDAYISLGICITKGSYNNLVAFPAMKEPDKNDWPEEDGQEFAPSTSAFIKFTEESSEKNESRVMQVSVSLFPTNL